MILEIAIIVFHFVWVAHGFCGINTATTVDIHMLLRGSSDIINGKVNQIIQQYKRQSKYYLSYILPHINPHE